MPDRLLNDGALPFIKKLRKDDYMKRKMVFAGFPFAFCLFVSSFMSFSVSLLSVTAVFILSAVLVFVFKRHRKYILVISIALIFALMINILHNKLYVEKLLDFSGKSVAFSGSIKDYSYFSSDTLKITAKGKINSDMTAEITFLTDSVKADYGDKIDCILTVNEIKNSDSFSSKDYYNSLGVYLEGKEASSVKITPVDFSFMRCILKYRDYLFEKITTYLPDDTGGFIGAMLCSDKTEIDSGTKLSLYRCGLGHIFAQSGIHLVIITGLIYSVLSVFLKNKKLLSMLSLSVILLFTLFAGASPSVIRAAVMSGLIHSSYLFNRKPDALNSLALSAVIILLISPESVRSISFILSFSGAFSVGVLSPYLYRKFSDHFNCAFLSVALPGTCASLVTLPISVFYFSEISLISPVTNILLVPICTLALTLTALVAVVGGASVIAYPILSVSSLLVKAVIKLCEILSSLPFSYAGTGSIITKALVFLFCGSCVLLLIFSKRLSEVLTKSYTLFSLVCLCSLVSSLIFRNSVYIHNLTADNKTVFVAIKNNYAAVFDTSGKSGLGSAVETVLEKSGVKNVDIFLSQNTSSKEAYYKNNIYTDISSCSDITNSSAELKNLNMQIINAEDSFTVYFDGKKICYDKNNNTVTQIN